MNKTLSICMMVKNEERNLERCLESLRELMKNVASELIIVDTGSDDNTVAIAQRYTDRVYHHPWNNNFSEMRNISISYASGEWLFIIDADEELLEPQNLILFLKQTHPKSVAGGALLVKNLTADNAEKNIVVLNSARIFRNDGNFRYEGAVHNMPVINGQILEIEATLNHYGYNSTDHELMEQKFIRTSKILKDELEKNPDNIYYRFQLSVTYMMHKEYGKALEEIEQAYQIMEERAADKKKHLYVYCQLARSYMRLGKYQEVEKACLEGIAIENEYIDLYFYNAQAQAAQENYEQAIDNYCQFIKLVENFDKLEIKRNPAINHYTLSHVDEALYNVSVMFYKTGQFDQAITYIDRLISTRNVDAELLARAIPLLVETCFAAQVFKCLRDILSRVKAQSIKLFEQALYCIEQNRVKLAKKQEQDFYQVFACYEGQYGVLNQIRLLYSNGDVEELNKVISLSMQAFDLNTLPDYYGDLLYYLTKLGKPEELLGNVTDLNAIRYLKYFADEYGSTLNEAILAYCSDDFQDRFTKIRSKKILLKYVLFSEEFSDENYLLIFHKYLTNGIAYVQQIYNPFVLEQELIHDVKSVEEAFLLFMLKAMSSKDDESRYVRYLKNAVMMFPEMNRGIRLLLKEKEKSVNNIAREITDLKSQLLEHIKTLLDAGQGALAKKVIEEYEKISGPGIESLMLKSQAMLL
ncbi:MAG TPA: glycosyltransferase [Desulfitobacteriaceae bacterium]|nr:glycosyltransferase [Desulfitobacteriaceae bacterium]